MQAFLFQAIVALLGAREFPADLPARYAQAFESVAATERSYYSGEHAAEKSALLDLALVYQESGIAWEKIENCTFRTDHGWQDWGKALGVSQVHLDSAGIGYTREDICGDVELQVRLAHRYLARQVRSCGGNVERGVSRYNGASACMVTVYSARVMATHRRLRALFGF